MVDDLLALTGQVLATKEESAGGGLVNTGDHIKYGGFAGAVRTDQSIKLSLFNLQIQILNSLQTAKGDSEILNF